jgi:hypothetical protein
MIRAWVKCVKYMGRKRLNTEEVGRIWKNTVVAITLVDHH